MKKIFTLLLISFLLCCASLQAQDTTNFWQEVETPSCKAIDVIHVDRFTNEVYIVSKDGFFVTTDKGSAWTFLGPIVSDVIGVTDMVTNELGYIYATTGSKLSDNGSIFLSKDKCKTWVKLYESELHAVFINSYPNGLLYSSCVDGTSTSVLRSTDYGQTWDKVLTFQAVMEFPQDALVYNDSIVYIATNKRYELGGGIYRSEDSGNTWSNIGLQGNDCKSIILNMDNDVVVGATSGLSEDGGGVFKLKEDLAWDRLSPPFDVTNLCINNLGDIFFGHHLEGNTYGYIVKLTHDGVLEKISYNLGHIVRVKHITIDNDGYLYMIKHAFTNKIYRSNESTTTAYKLSQIPEVNVYPNPAKDKINLITNSQNIDLSDAILQFYNINGDNFKNIKYFCDNIDISGFPKGLILCKLTKDNLVLSQFKFIKLEN